MSEPAIGTRASFSSAGYEDGLGRRTLVFDRETGATVERLTLRPEFGAFERALRDRAAQLAAWEGDGLARPQRVHREQPRGPLCVDAERPAGDRLADLLDASVEGRSDQPLAGVNVALGFLISVLQTFDRLHRRGRVVHGAVAPGRLLLVPSGRVVLLDALYGDALERLAWPPARLWRELGVAVPARPAARGGVAGDVAQAGVVSLMLVLGRPLREDEWPGGLPAAIAEAREIAELHGGGSFASGLQTLFDRLLPSDAPPVGTATDALQHVRALAAEAMGVEACAAALVSAADAMANLPMPEMPDVVGETVARPLVASTAPPAVPATPAKTAPLHLHIDIAAPPRPAVAPPPEPDAAAPVPLPEATLEPAPIATPEPEVAIEPAPVPTPPPAPGAPEPAVAVVAEPVPEREPVAEVAAATRAAPEPIAAAPAPIPAAAEPVAAAPEAPKKAPSPRRGKRERRRKDALRSSTPEAPAPAPLVTAAPVVPEPPAPVPPAIAVRPAPKPVFPQPVFPQPGAYGAAGGAPTSAYLEAGERVPYAAPVVRAQPSPSPIQPAGAPIAVHGAPIGIKGKPVIPPKPQRLANPYDAPGPTFAPPPRKSSGGSRWKIAGAAIVVLVAGVAAGRAYLPDRTNAVRQPSGSPAPAAAVPVTPANGTLVLSSTPAGARVLVDGNPAGETPLTLETVTPGRRTITFVAAGGSVTRTVRVGAGETVTVDVPVFSGWLAVDAQIVLEVAQNGRVIGTSQARLLMPPGRHTVTLTNAELGYRTTEVIDIEPGAERRLTLVPATEVNLNASPWAEVWIDGTRVGETPIGRVSIPLGTREVIFRHPQYGDRKLTPTIRVGEPAAISVDFTGSGQR